MDSANRILKKSNQRSIFIKVSATLTLLPFLASTNLYTMALANDPSGRGAAWQQFKLDNPGMKGGELNRLFKAEWGGANFKTHIPQAHTQNIDAGGTVNLQSTNQPTVIDLSQAGTTINQGVHSVVDTNGNVTITADPGANVGNVQLINAPTNNVIDLGNSITLNAAGNTSGGNINVTTTDAINLNTNAGSINVGSGSTVVNAGTIGSNTQVNTTNVSVVVSGSNTSTGVLTAPTTPINLGSNSSLNITPIVGGGKTPHVKEPKVPQIKEPKIPQIKEPKVPVVKEPKVPHVKEPKVQSFAPQTVQQVASKVIGINGGIALDLGSAAETITLGDKLFQNQESVTINVGGQEKTFSAGSKVTAAEYVAAKQVMSGTSQTVTLDSDGRATGGQIDLSALTSGNKVLKVTDLTVPVSVTASGDFGKGGDVIIKGDLTNSGSIKAFNSNGGQLNAAIRADNITNSEGASITSSVSDLTLDASKNFANYGDISSTGNLTISAGKTLTNNGSVSSTGNLNVLAPKVTNTGTLASTSANVNLDTPVAQALAFNNTGGTISALDGAINIRSADYAAKYNSAVVGGDLLSKELNAYTGAGTTDIYVKELTGVLNTNGSAAHVSADTGNLILGNQCLVDDPTYYNTGNISINGSIVVGEKLAIIAGGDINAQVGALSISAAGTNGNPDGQDIVIIAGADVTGVGPQPSTVSGFPPSGNATSATVSGASATGGNINFTVASIALVINSKASETNGDGGNILLAAYDSDGSKGKILLSTASVLDASGGGDVGTKNGNIKIIAGAQSGSAIQLGTLFSGGINSQGGDIQVVNAQPVSSDGKAITFNQLGAITSGNTLVAGTPGAGQILINYNITARGNVSLRGSSIQTGNINVNSDVDGVSAGNVYIESSGNLNVGNINASHGVTTGNAGSVTLISNSATPFQSGTGSSDQNKSGTINISNSGVGNAGSLNITNRGGDINLLSSPIFSVVEGNGANLTFDANGSLDLAPFASTIDVRAQTGVPFQDHVGGSITLRYASLLNATSVKLFAQGTGIGGHGGNITLENYAGNVTIGSGVGNFQQIDSQASEDAANGNLIVKAAGDILFSSSAIVYNIRDLSLDSGNDITLGKPTFLDHLGDVSVVADHNLTVTHAFTGVNLNASAGNQLTVNADQNFTGGMSFSASNFFADNVTLTANRISVEGNSLKLQTSNGLVFQGTAATRVTAITGDLTLDSGVGAFTYNGGAIISANTQGASINATNSTNNTDTQSYLLTGNLVGGTFGPGGIPNAPGPLWTFANSGTYANNPGNVTLSGAINFLGGNFAIISTGDIDLTGATINLSSPTIGGKLTLLAGYNFDYETSGGTTDGVQKFSQGTMSNIAANATGGSILGAADINTSGGTGNGGNVIAAANRGTISLGDINTSSTGGTGGQVTLIATNGIDLSTGTVNTSGSAFKSSVALAVGNAQIAPGASITNGALSAGAVTIPVLGSNGNIVLGNMNVGSLSIRGALNAADTITQANGATLTASQVSLNAGDGAVTLSNLSTFIVGVSGNNGFNSGSVTLNNIGDTNYNLFGAHNFTGTATGRINSVDGIIGTLTLTASGSAGSPAISIASGVDVANSATLTTLGGGGIVGEVNAGTNLTINSSGDIGVNGADPFITTAQTMNLSAAGSISVLDNNTGVTNIQELSVGGNLYIATAGSLTSDVQIQANGVCLTTLNGNIGASGNAISFDTNGVMQLIAKGGSIFATGNFDSTATAIAASGNVDLTGAVFNLNGNDGGNACIIAGYDFAVALGTPIVVSNFVANSTGGSIIGNANFSLAGVGVGGTGGNFLAVANGGTVNSGSISLGLVNTQGDGAGGNVLVLGEGGTSVTDAYSYNTAGNNLGGTIGLYSAGANVANDFQISAGAFDGEVTVGALTNHAINASILNAGGSNVDLATGLNTGGAITVNTSIAARSITMSGNSILLGFDNMTTSVGVGQSGAIDLTANTITTTSGNPLLLNTNGASSGEGGSISLNLLGSGATTFGSEPGSDFQLIAGAFSGAGVAGIVNINSAGDVNLNANAILVAGLNDAGEIVINTTANLTVNANSMSTRSGSGDGAKFTLSAGTDGSGTLLLNDVNFFAQANAIGVGDGGRLALSGAAIVTPSSGTFGNPLILTAMGAGNGDGGEISFKTKETIAAYIGSTGKPPKGSARFLEAYALGTENAGKIEIETGGNLIVNDVTRIDASGGNGGGGPFRGADYTLKAGTVTTGALVINGALSASGTSGGDGGRIELSSRSSTAFTIGGTKAPKNGILGPVSAIGNGGTVSIENLGGGISVASAGVFNVPNLELHANGSKGTIASKFTIAATESLLLTASSGAIGGKKALFVDTPSLQVSTNGLVGITNNYAGLGPSILQDSLGGTGFTLKTVKDVTVNDITTNAGSILVAANTGTLFVNDGADLVANNGALTLQVLGTGAGSRIVVGDNSTVKTAGIGKAVSLVVGPTIPRTGTNPVPPGSAPSGMNTSITPGNFIFLGPANSIVVVGSADVVAKNQNVIFNNLSAAGEVITLGNGSHIEADPPTPVRAQSSNAGVAAVIPASMSVSPATKVAAMTSTNDHFQSSPLFGFAGENGAYTADLSVVSLNAPQQVQDANASNLMTGSNAELVAYNSSLRNLSQNAPSSSVDEDNSYVVGYCPMTGVVEGAICTDSDVAAESASMIHQSIQRVQHSERVVIKSGNVLFVPLKATTVVTPNGIVHIDAKSVALVSSTDAGLAVYDLEDQHKGAVTVESNGHSIALAPGRHVMVTKHHTAEFAQINAVETIAHRNVQSIVKNGHRAHISEFSVLSAMDTVKPLKALAMSRHSHAKQITERMMKTTAIILQLDGGSGGQYQHYFKPRLTAKL